MTAQAGPNQVVYWSRPLDWRNQTLTPNPDAIYFMPFPGPGGALDQDDAGQGWLTYFRIHGPEAAAFDGAWKPADFEAVK